MVDINISGEIGVDCTVQSIREQLAIAGGQPITCRFFSEGGSVFEGFAISNLLREYAGQKTAVVDAAFSISSYIAVCSGFQRVSIAKNGYMMLHSPYSENEETTPSEQRLLSSLSAKMIEGYVERTRKPSATIARLMSDETFLDAGESIRLGLVDGFAESSPSMRLAAKLRTKINAKQKTVAINQALYQWDLLVSSYRRQGMSAEKSLIAANKSNPQLRIQAVKEGNLR